MLFHVEPVVDEHERGIVAVFRDHIDARDLVGVRGLKDREVVEGEEQGKGSPRLGSGQEDLGPGLVEELLQGFEGDEGRLWKEGWLPSYPAVVSCFSIGIVTREPGNRLWRNGRAISTQPVVLLHPYPGSSPVPVSIGCCGHDELRVIAGIYLDGRSRNSIAIRIRQSAVQRYDGIDTIVSRLGDG